MFFVLWEIGREKGTVMKAFPKLASSHGLELSSMLWQIGFGSRCMMDC